MSMINSEMAIKNGNSLPRSFIRAVSHPTQMTRWQKIAFTIFMGVVTGGVAFGAAFGFGAREITSGSIAAGATLVVLIATAILISKRKLSPDEFLQLNEAREQASIQYEASLPLTYEAALDLPLDQRNANELKALKSRYMKLLRQQISQPLQEDREAVFQRDDGEFIIVPSRAILQKTLDDLIAS